MSYTGWVLSHASREELLGLLSPTRPLVYAHHITYALGDDAAMPAPAQIRVVGIADSHGVQVLVVTVDDATHAPDGRLYHCTWSIDEDRSPNDANAALANGWGAIAVRLAIQAEPFMGGRPAVEK